MGQQYKIWRTVGSFADAVYVMIVADPPDGPETNWRTCVPEPIRRIGFWTGYKGGEIEKLKPAYRQALELQGFMVLADLDAAADVEEKAE